MIDDLERLAESAGRAIMGIYESRSFQVQSKTDASPLTDADLLAHHMIMDGLQKLSPLPIISEEAAKPVLDPAPDSYWLVDPLDGTKEFIHRRPTFTVNIALIASGKPVAGVVFAPESDEVFSAWQGDFRWNGKVQAPRVWPPGLTLVSSHSHPEPELDAFKKDYGIQSELRCGSSYKFCMIAKGLAHIYPRFRSLSAWDVAAGDAVARAAGCQVLSLDDRLPLRYAWQQPRVSPFCVLAPGVLLKTS